MLKTIITVCIFCIIFIFINLFSYRMGLKDAQSLLKNENIIFNKPKLKRKIDPDKREDIIRNNIENYTGDERGQMSIDS